MQNAKRKKGKKKEQRQERQEGATTKVQRSTDLCCDFCALVSPTDLKTFEA